MKYIVNDTVLALADECDGHPTGNNTYYREGDIVDEATLVRVGADIKWLLDQHAIKVITDDSFTDGLTATEIGMKELVEADLMGLSIKQLHELAEIFDVPIAGNKKIDYIDALQEFRTKG